MDRLDELIVFTTILDAGSLAGAARRLRRSPPSITRSLAAIEERAGVRLVQRTTRQLAPTEAGRRLAARARRLIADYHETIGREDEKLRTELRGLLRITAPTLFGRWHVTPIVASFLDLHPRIRIELVLTNRNLDLIKEGLDLAVRTAKRSRSCDPPRRSSSSCAVCEPRISRSTGPPANAEGSAGARNRFQFASAFSGGVAVWRPGPGPRHPP